MFGENYSRCAYKYYYDYSSYYGPGSYYQYNYNYDRLWNYDPLSSSYTYTYRYQAPNRNANPPVPYQYDYTYSGTYYPIFSYYGSYNSTTYTYTPFEVKPPVKDGIGDCYYSGIQTASPGGALMAMCDGSVKSISPSININTWRALGTPNSGDNPGGDW
jgi:hypothetical protein